MRILVITNYYPPYYKGGYELACRDCCEFLASRGHQIFILSGHYGLDFPQKAAVYEEMKAVRSLKYIDYTVSSYLGKCRVERHNYYVTERAIWSVKPDIVYIWNMQAVSLAPVLAAAKSGVKRIFEIGDLWPGIYIDDYMTTKVKAFIKSVLPCVVGGRADVSPVIAVSKWIGVEMAQKYGSKRVYVVPNGIKEPLNIKTERNHNVTKYIFTGRIDPQKGIETAIDAFAKLVRNNAITNFQFDIYGSGDDIYMEHCMQLVDKYGLESCIKFQGRVDDVINLYADYDIMIMPTTMREPFGMVTVEAMAAGLAVIATNKYGPAEIIADGVDGLLFAPGNSSQLAEKIALLHNDSNLYRRLAAAARKKYLDNYQLEFIKNKIEKILIAEISGVENKISAASKLFINKNG